MQWLLALTRTDDPRSCPACHADYIVHRDPGTESRGASARLTTHVAQSTVAHSLCNVTTAQRRRKSPSKSGN